MIGVEWHWKIYEDILYAVLWNMDSNKCFEMFNLILT